MWGGLWESGIYLVPKELPGVKGEIDVCRLRDSGFSAEMCRGSGWQVGG